MDCPSAGSGLRIVGSSIKPTPLPVSELLGSSRIGWRNWPGGRGVWSERPDTQAAHPSLG